MFATYFLWAGVWLTLVPWTALWDRNVFAAASPLLGACMSNPFMRGAVTGVGLITAAAGVRELLAMLIGRDGGEGRADRP